MKNIKENRLNQRKAWIGDKGGSMVYKDIEYITRENTMNSGTVVYTLTAWKGTSGKPFVNYYYSTKEQRDNALDYYKKRADERAEYILKKKLTKKEVIKHDLKKGNMFVTSWGYDQTNYDYIVVMEVSPSGKTVKCQRTSSLHHGQSCQSNLQEPIFCPFGDVFRMQVRKGYQGGVNLVGSYPYCYDGTGSRRKGYFHQVVEGQVYHETMAEFGH